MALTKAEIIESVHQQLGFPQKKSNEVVEQLIEIIKTDVPALRDEIKGIKRTSWMGKFSSAFRSRRKPISDKIAGEIISACNKLIKSGNMEIFSTTYVEALPTRPPKIDFNRQDTYKSFLGKTIYHCK